MSRALTGALDTALQVGHARPIILIKVNTLDGDLLVWTGQGNVSFNSETYIGMGDVIGISEVGESNELGAQGLTLSMSGIPQDKVTIAISKIQHNRLATIWLGALDIVTGVLIADPYQLFQGYTDVPSIKDNGSTSTISLVIENRMIDLQRPRTRRYTKDDQQLDFPSDEGFNFVPELQDTQIIWSGHDVQV